MKFEIMDKAIAGIYRKTVKAISDLESRKKITELKMLVDFMAFFNSNSAMFSSNKFMASAMYKAFYQGYMLAVRIITRSDNARCNCVIDTQGEIITLCKIHTKYYHEHADIKTQLITADDNLCSWKAISEDGRFGWKSSCGAEFSFFTANLKKENPKISCCKQCSREIKIVS